MLNVSLQKFLWLRQKILVAPLMNINGEYWKYISFTMNYTCYNLCLKRSQNCIFCIVTKYYSIYNKKYGLVVIYNTFIIDNEIDKSYKINSRRSNCFIYSVIKDLLWRKIVLPYRQLSISILRLFNLVKNVIVNNVKMIWLYCYW